MIPKNCSKIHIHIPEQVVRSDLGGGVGVCSRVLSDEGSSTGLLILSFCV